MTRARAADYRRAVESRRRRLDEALASVSAPSTARMRHGHRVILVRSRWRRSASGLRGSGGALPVSPTRYPILTQSPVVILRPPDGSAAPGTQTGDDPTTITTSGEDAPENTRKRRYSKPGEWRRAMRGRISNPTFFAIA
jgi:hypothetical protein